MTKLRKLAASVEAMIGALESEEASKPASALTDRRPGKWISALVEHCVKLRLLLSDPALRALLPERSDQVSAVDPLLALISAGEAENVVFEMIDERLRETPIRRHALETLKKLAENANAAKASDDEFDGDFLRLILRMRVRASLSLIAECVELRNLSTRIAFFPQPNPKHGLNFVADAERSLRRLSQLAADAFVLLDDEQRKIDAIGDEMNGKNDGDAFADAWKKLSVGKNSTGSVLMGMAANLQKDLVGAPGGTFFSQESFGDGRNRNWIIDSMLDFASIDAIAERAFARTGTSAHERIRLLTTIPAFGFGAEPRYFGETLR